MKIINLSLPDTHPSRVRARQALETRNHGAPARWPAAPMSYQGTPPLVLEPLDSVETLQTIGFTKDRATIIFNRYVNFHSDDPELNERPSLMSFARWDIRYSPQNVSDDSEDWRAACQALGITDELTEAILHPEFREIRLTGDLCWWLVQSLCFRFATLEEACQTREERTERHENQQNEDRDLNKALGYTSLWKGVAAYGINNALDDDGHIKNLTPFMYNPPCDFSPQTGFYFAAEKEIALRHARYLRHRGLPNSEVRLLECRIPNSLIENSRRQTLRWPEKYFKHFVWLNRCGGCFSEEFRHLIEQDCIIGHIVHNSNKRIKSMKDYNEITRDYVLTTADGEFATQYCFSILGFSELTHSGATVILHQVPPDEISQGAVKGQRRLHVSERSRI